MPTQSLQPPAAGAILLDADGQAVPAAADGGGCTFAVSCPAGATLAGHSLQLLEVDRQPLATLEDVSFRSVGSRSSGSNSKQHKLSVQAGGRIVLSGCRAPAKVSMGAKEYTFQVRILAGKKYQLDAPL